MTPFQVIPGSIRLLYTVCEARPGALLDECRRDAVMLAAASREDVHFMHNGVTYVAKSRVLVDSVMPKVVPVKPQGKPK